MAEPPKPEPVRDDLRQLDERPEIVALENSKVRAQGGTLVDAPEPEPEPEHAVKPKPESKSKKKQKQKRKKKRKPKQSAPDDDDDEALLAAAMAENASLHQAKQQEELHAAEEMLQSRTYTNFDERNRALAFKQMATRTIIPGQALPKEVTTALQIALKEIEAEDAAAGRGRPLTGAAEADQPFQNAPPSSTNDPRMLRRQQLMVERMRRKRHENLERQKLALDDPQEAQNCKRYNLTANQLRAVRRIGLRLPHECREQTAAKLEAAAIGEEDVLFPDDVSLDDMFGALREDDRFMSGSGDR
eukprot:COSAG02_NODE_3343_length_6898_cov_9.593617_3_plen_302_part_00